MDMIALQSGSNGNCIYVEADGVRLLFDAGISGRQAEQRLAAHGRDIRDVDALVISHDHRDHASCLGIYQRKYGFPVHVTRKTLVICRSKHNLGQVQDVRHYTAGASLKFGTVTVETIPTPHDGVDGVAFVVDDGRRRLGILTDLGHVFAALHDVITSLDAVLLESNYDPDMLAEGWYPEPLKRRIQGRRGHLANSEAAQLLRTSASPRLQWVFLGHLSEENNHPALALRAHREILGDQMPLFLASRDAATDVLECEGLTARGLCHARSLPQERRTRPTSVLNENPPTASGTTANSCQPHGNYLEQCAYGLGLSRFLDSGLVEVVEKRLHL